MKSVFALSFVIQVEDYEPMKLYASEEREWEGERPENLDVELAKVVMGRLESLSTECALKVREIKGQMMAELDAEE